MRSTSPLSDQDTRIRLRNNEHVQNGKKNFESCFLKWLSQQKILKTGRVLYLGLELTMHVLKSQTHLVQQSL